MWLVWVLAVVGAFTVVGAVIRWSAQLHAIKVLESRIKELNREYRELVLRDEKTWQDLDRQVTLMNRMRESERALDRLRGY